jgi:predicted O-linked N-acetylglucosamine transferase (SPINDLY family)
MPAAAMAEHHARLAAADIALDTWPCNGHTTTSDALLAGVPVVTLAGHTFASRVAASVLGAAGLGGCITHSPEAYTARVLALAADAGERARLREQLLSRSAPLFDTPRLASDLEALYQRMWARAVAGEAPAPLGA